MNGFTRAVVRKLCGGPYDGVPSDFWWLWFSIFVNRIANFVVPFCTLYFTVGRGMPGAVAGSLIGLYGIGTVVGSFTGGVASDRFGAKRTLVAGYTSAAISTMALGLNSNMLALAICVACVGMFNGVSRPAANILTVNLVPAEIRVKVFALGYWAMNLGFAVGCACAGLVANTSYALLFWIDGLTTLTCALMIHFRVTVAQKADTVVRSTSRLQWHLTFSSEWLAPLRDRVFAAIVSMSAVTAALLQQLTVTLPLAMRASGHSPTAYGAVAALNGILICGLQMPISSLVAKQPLALSLAIGSALLALGFGLTTFAISVLGYAVTLGVWTLGEIVIAPAAPALAAHLARDAEQGRYQGALGAAWGIGAIAGPIAGTFILARHGSSALWVACGTAGALVAVVYTALHWSMRRHEEPAIPGPYVETTAATHAGLASTSAISPRSRPSSR